VVKNAQRSKRPKVLLAAKTYGSVFYDKLPCLIARASPVTRTPVCQSSGVPCPRRILRTVDPCV